jgi:hypothetical protein
MEAQLSFIPGLRRLYTVDKFRKMDRIHFV